jgi:hypothetical protein
MHLAPALRRLTGASLDLWGDANERHRAVAALVAAWDRGEPAGLAQAVDRIDGAVLAGLAAIGLGRQPASRIEVDSYGLRFRGRVTPGGSLQIDIERVRQQLAAGGSADRVFHTWVHESVHARAPSTAGRAQEYRHWPGYEEGLAEGLARLLTNECARMTVEDAAYDFFVRAYSTLAQVAGVEIERLLRAVWRCPPGSVRDHFSETVAAAMIERDRTLPLPQAVQLMRVADRVFGERHFGHGPDAAILERFWKSAFR